MWKREIHDRRCLPKAQYVLMQWNQCEGSPTNPKTQVGEDKPPSFTQSAGYQGLQRVVGGGRKDESIKSPTYRFVNKKSWNSLLV